MLRSVFVLLFALFVAPALPAQYVFTKILSDGDMAPGLPGVTMQNVSKPNVSANGMIAFRGDTTAATADDVIYLGTTLVAASGQVAVGTGGAVFDNLLIFASARQVNNSGDVIFASQFSNALPTNDRGLHLNNTLLLRKGQTAPGLTDTREFDIFLFPALLNDGRYGFKALLDNAVPGDNEVIYFDGLPLPMNATSIFREGTTIVGGPLNLEDWDSTAFNLLDWNNNGDVIIDGDLAGSTLTDDVLVIKPAVGDYQLALRQGDSLSVPVGGTLPFESILEVKLNDATEWVIRGNMDTISTEDGVAIAKLGAATPLVIAQEGTSAAAATGVPGTMLGSIGGVGINNSGDVVVLANVTGGGVVYDEAVFLYSGGTLELIFADQINIASGLLTDIAGASLSLANDGSMVFEATVNGLDGIYRADPPAVLPPENLACDHVAGTTDVALTWDFPIGQVYSGLRVFVNGVAQVPDLPGSAMGATVPSPVSDQIVQFSVIGLDGVDVSAEVFCTTAVPSVPDVFGCSMPSAAILDLQPTFDTISIAQAGAIRDLYVEVRATHPFIGDLDPVSVTSPSGTTVTLMSGNGATQNAIRTFFTDDGVAPNSVPYSSNAFIQPAGPGTLSDFFCESLTGIWTLDISDIDFGDEGVLDEWCLAFDTQANPALDCCAKPTDLICTSAGPCGAGGVAVSWANNASYFLLELVRTDSGGSVTLPLNPNDTAFVDSTAVVGTTYEYRLQFVCASGGTTNAGPVCSVTTQAAVPPLSDLVCAPEFCNQEIMLSWSTGGVAYDAVTLQRNGSFLATVTGMTSFVDSAPVLGTATYSLIGECSAQSSAATDCTVNLVFEGPADFRCAADLMTGDVLITWSNQGAYTSLTLLRDGVLILPQPSLGDSSYVDANPLPGCSSYQLVAECSAQAGTVDCSLGSFIPGDDYLMIPESTGDTVGLYDAFCGAYVGDLITPASIFPMGFEAPYCAVLGPDDLIYLSDLVGDRVFRFDRQGVFVDIFADSSDGLDGIRGLQFDAAGNLFVADNDFVAVFDPAGVPQPNLILDGSDPVDIFPLASGRWVVSNIAPPDDVRDYQADGLAFNSVFALDFPLQLNEVSSGNLVVASFNEDSITEFNTTAGVVQTVPTQAEPRGVYELGNGKWIYTTPNGVWCVDPLSGISTQIRGGISARYIELLPGAAVGQGFRRGDCNGDGNTNIADAVRILNVLFPQGCTPGVDCPEFPCVDACDSNDDGATNIADAVQILSVLFPQGCTPGVDCPEFAAPGDTCGVDPTMDALDCASFPPCP
ncbi:MAG: proprotein convertase P-domain-containing protein [Planctomycetota bacterium]